MHLADHLVNAMQVGSSGERHVPPLQAKAWELLRFSPQMLNLAVESIDEQLEAVEEVFLKKTEFA